MIFHNMKLLMITMMVELHSKNMLEIENHMNHRDLKVPSRWTFQKIKNKYYRYGNNGSTGLYDTLSGSALKTGSIKYIKDYLRCVAGVDEAVGQMLDFFER